MSRSADLRLLKERAERLSDRENSAKEPDHTFDYLTFGIGDETYAFNAAEVRRVSRTKSVTPIPGLPEYVLGITYDSGRVYPAVDLQQLFGFAPRGLAEKDPMIVCGVEDLDVAVLADSILGIRSIASDRAVEPSETYGSAKRFMEGVMPDGLVIVSVRNVVFTVQQRSEEE